MRKLALIVIAAVAIIAIFVYLTRSPSNPVTPAAAPKHQQPQIPKHDVTVNLTDARAQLPQQQPQVPKQDVAADVTDMRAPSASSARKNSPRAAAPLTAEQQEQAACQAIWERRMVRERAALDAEPKDAAWAYPMEQKLREHLTQELRSGRVEVLGIECKTTFCEIRTLLLDPEGGNEFSAAISDVSGKSWNDFQGVGTSLSEESGKTFYMGRLTRPQFKESPQPPGEAQAQADCTARAMEKHARQRATRDAEPKDSSWAEPMEQLLRQYLTAQVGKQPIERLDIDCRTTFCRIEANGRTNAASMALQKAVQAAAAEPWASLRTGESGSSGYGDNTWKQQYLLHRQ